MFSPSYYECIIKFAFRHPTKSHITSSLLTMQKLPESEQVTSNSGAGTPNLGLHVRWRVFFRCCRCKPFQVLAGLNSFEFDRVVSENKRASEGAPAIKQVAHGRCLGRRHGRLILPCRFSVFTCFVCAFAHFCATCYRYDTFAHADTDFRVSAFLCFCGIRYPFTRMFALAVSPA